MVALTGCAGTVAKPGDLPRLRIMAPASPGGGWDTTARLLQRVIRSTGLARNVQVFNVEGAGGAIGLGAAQPRGRRRAADDDGPGDGRSRRDQQVEGEDLGGDPDRPAARRAGDLVVPASSPYRTLKDFVEDWRGATREHPVAGGSAGGTDQILTGLLAQAGDVDPKQIDDIPYSGGGQSLAALLGGKVAAGISGIGEYGPQVVAGKLRGLAVSSEKRSAQVPDVPTMTVAGYDMVLSDWRGRMSHPQLAPDARSDLAALVTQARDSPEWKDVLAKNGFDDLYLTGDDFGTFLTEEEQRVPKVLAEIGLT